MYPYYIKSTYFALATLLRHFSNARTISVRYRRVAQLTYDFIWPLITLYETTQIWNLFVTAAMHTLSWFIYFKLYFQECSEKMQPQCIIKKEFRTRVHTSKRSINLKMKTIGQGKFFEDTFFKPKYKSICLCLYINNDCILIIKQCCFQTLIDFSVLRKWMNGVVFRDEQKANTRE